MKLTFLQLSLQERKSYIEEAGARRGLSPVILEKDFWVCWLLSVVFQSSFRDAVVFKGGTSLSKVFGVVDRFSEDIDLSIAPAFLGIDEPATAEDLSKNQASRWMEKAEAMCIVAVRDSLAPELESAIRSVLGERETAWLTFEVDPISHSPVLLFHYPTSQAAAVSYLKSSVKLEFGSLTDQQPTTSHSVRPWMADAIPEGFGDWNCAVVALDVHRTFWEKATILHVEYHRPTEKPTPDRFARHYSDTAALALHSDASAAVARLDLCERVVHWKSRFFGSAWARYDLAVPPTFRLLPQAGRETALRSDYRAMREMYASEPPAFEQILDTLADTERRINATS